MVSSSPFLVACHLGRLLAVPLLSSPLHSRHSLLEPLELGISSFRLLQELLEVATQKVQVLKALIQTLHLCWRSVLRVAAVVATPKVAEAPRLEVAPWVPAAHQRLERTVPLAAS